MAEVLEFREPGGMMDHCAAAYGGVIAIDFKPEFAVESLDVELGAFVLGIPESRRTPGGSSPG